MDFPRRIYEFLDQIAYQQKKDMANGAVIKVRKRKTPVWDFEFTIGKKGMMRRWGGPALTNEEAQFNFTVAAAVGRLNLVFKEMPPNKKHKWGSDLQYSLMQPLGPKEEVEKEIWEAMQKPDFQVKFDKWDKEFTKALARKAPKSRLGFTPEMKLKAYEGRNV